MARYIDADRLMTKIHELYVQPNIELWQVLKCVGNSPTADVVPKSEVKELQTEIEELQAMVAKLRKENIELLVSKETDIYISMEKMVKVRTEHPIVKAIEEKVAREIFEEINTIKKEYASGDIDGNELYVRLYMLEKKYTENKE